MNSFPRGLRLRLLVSRCFPFPRSYGVKVNRDAESPLGGKRPYSRDDLLFVAYLPVPGFLYRERRNFTQLSIRESRQIQ